MILTDRTMGSGDCIIVTGCLAPHFGPLVYRTKADALRYVEEIRKAEKAEQVNPPFSVYLEDRWWSEMNPRICQETYTPVGFR